MASRIEDLRWGDIEWPTLAPGTRIRIMEGEHARRLATVVHDDGGPSLTFRLEDGSVDSMGKRWINDVS